MTDIELLNQKLDKIISLLESQRRTPVAYNQPPPGIQEQVTAWHAAAPAGVYAIADIARACAVEPNKSNAVTIGRIMDRLGAHRWKTASFRGFRIE